MLVRRILCLLALIALPVIALPRGAAAAWSKPTVGNAGTIFAEVSSPNGTDVFVGGFNMSVSGIVLTITNKVWASSNGGATYRELAAPWGALSGPSAASVSALEFIDASTGWAAIGTKLWKTASAGAEWTSVTTPFVPRDLHFFSGTRGVAVADDGKIFTTNNGGAAWTPATSPTTVDLRQMYWLDATKGYATGYDEADEPIPGSESGATYPVPSEAVLLKTTDAGLTWTLLRSQSGVAFSGVWFGADGQSGWLGRWTRSDETTFRASLAKTVNGGAAWADVTLPLQVGTASFAGFSGPIYTAHLHAIRFDGAQGRMIASAYINDETAATSSGDGTSSTQRSRNMKLVDYTSSDGGASWSATNLGTIVLSTSGGQTPSDGDVQEALLWGQKRGWAVATKGHAWRDDAACSAAADCGSGLTCEAGACAPGASSGACAAGCTGGDVCVGGTCVAPTNDCDPACSGGLVCLQGSCMPRDESPGDDGGPSAPRSSLPGEEPEDEGCAATRGDWLGALAVSLLALLRARRR